MSELAPRARLWRAVRGGMAVLALLYLLMGGTAVFTPLPAPWNELVVTTLLVIAFGATGWLFWLCGRMVVAAEQEKTAALAEMTQRLAQMVAEQETGRETAVSEERRPPSENEAETPDLPNRLRQMVQKMTPGTLVRGKVVVTGDLVSLSEAVEAELLHIAEASVISALKHGKPSAINVELAYLPEMVRLVVQDNGRGFDPAQPAAGFGLTGLRERAMRIGAQLTVKMRPEGGSEVVCLVKKQRQQNVR